MILDAVQPNFIAFFGISSALDQLTTFLHRLAGLIHYALNKRSGQVTLLELAAATNQREWTIRKGIEWWIAHGELSLVETDGKVFTFQQGGALNQDSLNKIEQELNILLQETAAFRSYFLRADPHQLLE
jgi:hypothetical protein